MKSELVKEFMTPEFSGAWFTFHGDRMDFREKVQEILREKTLCRTGVLNVDERGPRFVRENEDTTPLIHLSYAHTEGHALLVYSEKSALGVDIELKDRKPGLPVEKLSKRFFSASEASMLNAIPAKGKNEAFLKLWVKKEAYAKLTRKGLVHSLPLEVSGLKEARFVDLPVSPTSVVGCVAFTYPDL